MLYWIVSFKVDREAERERVGTYSRVPRLDLNLGLCGMVERVKQAPFKLLHRACVSLISTETSCLATNVTNTSQENDL